MTSIYLFFFLCHFFGTYVAYVSGCRKERYRKRRREVKYKKYNRNIDTPKKKKKRFYCTHKHSKNISNRLYNNRNIPIRNNRKLG